MAEPKTRPTKESVTEFFSRLDDEPRRQDCATIVRLMKKATGAKAVMWGTSIVGFGTRQIPGAGGKMMDWPLIAFSPRKNDLTLYVGLGRGNYGPLLDKLGKHKAGKGCLYIKRLADVDVAVLEKLLAATVKDAKSNA